MNHRQGSGVRDLMICKLIKSTPWHCPSSIFIATSLDLTYWLPYIYMINNRIKKIGNRPCTIETSILPNYRVH
jgi:hypothetical protein